MAPSIYPAYPPELDEKQVDLLRTVTSEYALASGLTIRPADAEHQKNGSALAQVAPVTLFPSLFPKKCFEQAINIQKGYNEVYAKVASDVDFLKTLADGLSEIDEFIARLWDVHQRVEKEGYVQDLSLGIFRSDYMVHSPSSSAGEQVSVRQVEFNTIASSFGGLSSRVGDLHKYLLGNEMYPESIKSIVNSDKLPSNKSISSIAAGMAASHSHYGPSKSKPQFPLCILFVVSDYERNVWDQKHIEHALWSAHSIHVFRLPWSEIRSSTAISTDSTRALIYIPPAFPERNYEVTTVYFRHGYSPDHYASQADWDARYHLERSAAIKCPTILTHLAGCKKVQQILATPGSRYMSELLDNQSLETQIESTFAPMYPLDASDDAGKKGRELALDAESAARFVLKPQREGGGNNIYRKAIPEFLKSLGEGKWPAYILMEMIETPEQRNAILRDGEVMSGGVICELGVYGTCVWRSGKNGEFELLYNEEAGHLLRTKGDTSEEGGVAAGFGAVDSVCLVDI